MYNYELYKLSQDFVVTADQVFAVILKQGSPLEFFSFSEINRYLLQKRPWEESYFYFPERLELIRDLSLSSNYLFSAHALRSHLTSSITCDPQVWNYIQVIEIKKTKVFPYMRKPQY